MTETGRVGSPSAGMEQLSRGETPIQCGCVQPELSQLQRLSGTLTGRLGLHVWRLRDLSGLEIHTGESANRMELKAMLRHEVAVETEKGRG